MRSFLLFCVAWGLGAQTVSSPVAGVVLDDDGRLLSVIGVAGNLLPGRALPSVSDGQPIETAAFSASAGVIKTPSQIVLTDSAGIVQSWRDAPDGAALFAFATDGTVQWVCFANLHKLQNLSGGASVDTSAFGDAVIALGLVNGNTLRVLTQKGGQLWAETVTTGTGAVSLQIPISGGAPAVYFEGGWLTTIPTGLAWQSDSAPADLREIPAPAKVLSLQVAGAHATAVNGRWLLGGNWQLLEIPFTPRVRPRERLE